MKEYVIWFKSGNSISGITNKDVTDKLMKDFMEADSDCRYLKGYLDEDGTTIIDLSQIEAISINNCSENNNIGFSKS
ncbi:hypothetical protein KLP19_18885 [Clostridioides difficile]|uniref:hypothetical protein n=1 Tax=Clostridioides difficile TaxID=1496 RepID=UPI00093FBEAF|nr:hypothetical protein [Clostridioides difficile]EGT3745363.1 hypothetical protein [Clostridioides difficile]EGT4949041.1 hypothetical protein [Clostridioides difficile]EKS6818052.1 hypothetical protein [Clostridioides difficile]MBY1335076.1 hypothetical protein [Clostridioides difficile]MCE4854229.1 hypothetical protein [Clostridioides difficile]